MLDSSVIPMAIPTEKQINLYNSLDEFRAVKNFLGLDHDSALRLFKENFLYYQEDLMFMGPTAFEFYIFDAFRYLNEAIIDDFIDGIFILCEDIIYQIDGKIAVSITAVSRIIEELNGIKDKIQRSHEPDRFHEEYYKIISTICTIESNQSLKGRM